MFPTPLAASAGTAVIAGVGTICKGGAAFAGALSIGTICGGGATFATASEIGNICGGGATIAGALAIRTICRGGATFATALAVGNICGGGSMFHTFLIFDGKTAPYEPSLNLTAHLLSRITSHITTLPHNLHPAFATSPENTLS
jgi:hypothetical protein